KILAGRVNKICVAYTGMEKYFPKEKIIVTGNPVRNFHALPVSAMAEAYHYFNIIPGKPVLLVLGGSLGAKTINDSVLNGIDSILNQDIQLIWQTGKVQYGSVLGSIEAKMQKLLRIFPFIDRMDFAYSVANVVISRAGAISISEL